MKRSFFWLCLFVLLSGFISPPAHPIYVSVCEIDFNPDTRHLEVALRLFIDDLEQCLEAEGVRGPLRIGTDQESPEAMGYLERYVRKHLQFKVEDRSLEMDFLGSEPKQEVVWCYLEVKDLPVPPASLTLSNSVLMDLLEEQKNIVYFRSQGEKTNLLLRRGKSEAQVSY